MSEVCVAMAFKKIEDSAGLYEVVIGLNSEKNVEVITNSFKKIINPVNQDLLIICEKFQAQQK